MPALPRALALATLLALPFSTLAQEAQHPQAPAITRTFFLKNSDEVHQTNEIVTAIRNTLDPITKIYLLPTENALVVTGNEDQIDLTTRLLQELDRPRKSYRLTFTLTTLDNNKPIGTEHFSMIAVSGQRTMLKQGSKVPIVTGSYEPKSDSTQTQVTYLDIGMNFDATLTEFATGVRLQAKVEQSSIAPELSSVGANDPIVRQSVLEGTSILTPGKPLLLGSLDIPGSTRHVDVAVTMDPAS